MNSQTSNTQGQQWESQRNWNPYQTPTTVQPNYTQPYVQMPVHLSIEDRISNIEKDIKEIKDMLNQIKWRV
jgi:hypothetical protein